MTSTERRKKLSQMFHDTFPDVNIYYDPPESIKLKYPAIIYNRAKIDMSEANNHKYIVHDRYTVTYIRKRSDDDNVDLFLDLPYIDHDRTYKVDDLYHDVYTIYI